MNPSSLVAITLSLLGVRLFGVEPAFRAGVGKVEITPPVGVPMAGYYHERGADGVLDPLYGKALVIESEGERVALVTLDLISVTRTVTDRARSLIAKKVGIKVENVLISATHAHTGPDLPEPGKRGLNMGGQQQLAVEYAERLPGWIAESVRLANETRRPVRLSTAKGECEGLTFNRRYFMRDGRVGWNPGKLNPEIVMPAGPNDPGVGVLYVEPAEANGPAQAIATYVNFAMHPDTTGGSKLSADWPGALGRVLAGYHGSNHLTLVGNGACGNLNHLDFSWRWPQGGAGEQHRIGTMLGASVFQAYKGLRPLRGGAVRARTAVVELPVTEVSPGEVEEANAILATTKDDVGTNFMRLVRAHRVLDVADRKGKPLCVEVQVIAAGPDLAWVGLPGEVFVELGLAIKRRSPFPQTLVVELANEDIGYIPDRRSYAEGNYEPESARCAAGSGERLVEAAVAMLREVATSLGTNLGEGK